MRRPMTAEQQLERSVLESKEREELHAIAQAMDIKTTTRSKKADLIDQILSATGVANGATNGANGVTNGAGAPEVASQAAPVRAPRTNGKAPAASMAELEAELDAVVGTNGAATTAVVEDGGGEDAADVPSARTGVQPRTNNRPAPQHQAQQGV